MIFESEVSLGKKGAHQSGKRKFKVLILLLCLVFSFSLPGQEITKTFKRNAIYLEGLGQGILYSINYDFRIQNNISLRAGFSHWSINPLFILTVGKLSFTSFPVTINYLRGGTDNFLELGIGVMPTTVTLDGNKLFWGEEIKQRGSVILGTATVGYRYQPYEGGYMTRISFTPLFNTNKFIPYGGISVGYAF